MLVHASYTRGAQMAERFDARRALNDYPAEFLGCRDLGHSWTPVGYFRENGTLHRLLKCERCPMTAEDEWTSRFERLPRRYDAPDGYYFVGSGGVDRAHIRREVARRATPHTSRASLLEQLTTVPRLRRRTA